MKTCKWCKTRFSPARKKQICCCAECALSYGQKQSAKAERIAGIAARKVTKAKLDAIKPRSQLMREAQAAFNKYIRARDQAAGHACISSGRPLDWTGNSVDAGHYRSVGSAPHLRFDERNCHAQSKHDNRYLSGNAVDYRIGLIARIGLEAVIALEADQAPRKYSNNDLRAIKADYTAKIKAIGIVENQLAEKYLLIDDEILDLFEHCDDEILDLFEH